MPRKVLLMMLAIGFGATAFGARFRVYSIATLAILVLFGALTFGDAPRISANQATPWAGVWERINVGVFLLWVAVLAAALQPSRPSNALQDDARPFNRPGRANVC